MPNRYGELPRRRGKSWRRPKGSKLRRRPIRRRPDRYYAYHIKLKLYNEISFFIVRCSLLTINHIKYK